MAFVSFLLLGLVRSGGRAGAGPLVEVLRLEKGSRPSSATWRAGTVGMRQLPVRPTDSLCSAAGRVQQRGSL